MFSTVAKRVQVHTRKDDSWIFDKSGCFLVFFDRHTLP